jgi:hypothetical protein
MMSVLMTILPMAIADETANRPPPLPRLVK